MTHEQGRPLHEDAPDGTPAPTVHRGSFGGVRLNVLTEGGRIVDYWAEPSARKVSGGEDLGPVLVTVEPPTDPFLHRLDDRLIQRFTVHRVERRDESGAVVDRETVLTVRVHLNTDKLDLTDARTRRELATLKERAAEGADQTFNLGQRLPNGDLLRVRTQVVDRPGEGVSTILVEPKEMREGHVKWHLRTEAYFLGHELGHHLGLRDEYREAGDRRVAYPDGSLMATHLTDRRGRFSIGSADNSPGEYAPHVTDTVLQPRHLRQLGAVIDGALMALGRGATGTNLPHPNDGLPTKVKLAGDVVRRELFGGPDGRGGHLLPYAGSDRPAPERLPGGVNRNGTVLVRDELRRETHTSRLAGDVEGRRTRVVFPGHWTLEQTVYAVEQAHLAARRAGTIDRRPTASDGGAATGPADVTYRWTGEYAGVRIEGEVRGDRILSFRPSHDQSGLEIPAHLLWRAKDPAFTQPAEDHVRYGNRHLLAGVHTASGFAAETFHGVRTRDLAGSANANGTYQAKVWFLDPKVNPDAPEAWISANWHRRSDSPTHTMYPRDWRLARIERAVAEAYEHRRTVDTDGRTERWVGEADGVRIEGITRDGVHLAHRPAAEQPAPARHDPGEVVTVSPARQVPIGPGDRLHGVLRELVSADGGREIELTVRVHVDPAEIAAHQGDLRADLQRYANRLLGGAEGDRGCGCGWDSPQTRRRPTPAAGRTCRPSSMP